MQARGSVEKTRNAWIAVLKHSRVFWGTSTISCERFGDCGQAFSTMRKLREALDDRGEVLRCRR